MKKIAITTLIAFALTTWASPTISSAATLPVNEVQASAINTVTSNGEKNAPVNQKVLDAVYSHFDKNNSYYHLGGAAKDSFSVIKTEVDNEVKGKTIRMKQIYKGIPVYGSEQIIQINDNDDIQQITEDVVLNIEDSLNGVDLKQLMNKDKALQIAKKDLKDIPQKFKEATSELNIYNFKGTPQLVYTVNLNYSQPDPARWVYFVDARSGKIVDKYNKLTYANAVGIGKGVLGDTKNINITYDSSKYLYYMQDNTRSAAIYTHNENNKTENTLSLPGILWYDVDNQFFNPYDAPAVDAHYYAGKVYDYYKNVHARNSLDNLDSPIISSVHYSSSYNNAFWDGSQMVYGDGDGTKYISLSGGLDVVAHELTHGVTEHTANLIYRNESGAINEAISDIFGTLIEYYYNWKPDWLIGEDVYTPATAGDALRSLADPAKYGDPDHYSKRYTGSDDNGGVHTNSGIINKAAYLISQGGTHYGVSVAGIGRDKLGKILYRTLTRYLVPTSNFLALRYGAVQAAADLYGATSVEVSAVKNAFKAVGIEEPQGINTVNVNSSYSGNFSQPDEVQVFKLNPSTILSGSSHITFNVYNTSAYISVYQDYNSYLKGKSMAQYTNIQDSVDFPLAWSGDIYVKVQSRSSGSFQFVNKGTYKEPTQHQDCSLEAVATQNTTITDLLSTLRNFRDNMNNTEMGNSLSSLYYSISTQIVDNIALDSNFRSSFKQDILNLSRLFSQLDKNSNYIISQEDYKNMQNLRQLIEPKLSDETKNNISKYWSDLKVDNIVGKKLTDFLSANELIKAKNSYSIIVKTKTDASSSQLISLTKQTLTAQGMQAGIEGIAEASLDTVSIPRTFVIQVNTSESVDKVIQALQKHSGIEYVQKTHIARSLASDVQYKAQWSLKNIGQNGGTPGADINYEKMITRLGSIQYDKTMIAVLDTGINYELKDFAGIVRTDIDKDFINMDNDAADDNYHGTHVSGIIASAYNNYYSMSGINNNSTILPVKVLDEEGSGTDLTLALGLKYAVDKGAKVINLSLAFGNSDVIPIVEDMLKYANSKGVTVIAAAGNDGYGKVYYPAISQYAISVGATDRYDSLWSSSNRGYGLDLVAPGVDIPSIVNYGEVELLSGTSMAAPHVAAVAGLLYSLKPGITPQQVETVFQTSCKDLGTIGPDYYYGWGRLDADAAISKVKSTVALPKVDAVYDNSTKVTGSSIAGYKIIVRNTSNVQLGTGLAGADGRYTVTIPLQKADSYVKVFAVNSSGLSSYATYSKVIDKTPPVQPTIGAMTTQSTVVKGKTEVSAKVSIYVNGIYRAQVTADSTGLYQYTITAQPVGTTIGAKAQDNYGNISATTVIKIQYPAVVINPVTTQSTSVSGKTTAYLSVSLYLNGVYKTKVTADSTGAYKISLTPQPIGTEVKLIAADSKLNTSVAAVTKVMYPAPLINPVTTQSTLVSGKTTAYLSVSLYLNGVYKTKVTADSTGAYKFPLTAQPVGTEVKLIATDSKLNTSIAAVAKVMYPAPVINPVTTKTTVISGKTAANLSVSLYLNGVYKNKVTADSTGMFKFPTASLSVGTVVKIVAVDSKLNSSLEAVTKVTY